MAGATMILAVLLLPFATGLAADAARTVDQGARDLGKDAGAAVAGLQALAAQLGDVRDQQEAARRKADGAAKAAARAEAAARRCDERAFQRHADQARRLARDAQDLSDRAARRLSEIEAQVQKIGDAVSDRVNSLFQQIQQGLDEASRRGLRDTSVAVQDLRRAQRTLEREVARQNSPGTEARGRQDEGQLHRLNRALDEFADAVRKTGESGKSSGPPSGLEDRLARAAQWMKENCGKKVEKPSRITVAIDPTEHVVIRLGPMTPAELQAYIAAQGITDYVVIDVPDGAGGGWLLTYRRPGAGVGPGAETDLCREYFPEGKGRGGDEPSPDDLRIAERRARDELERAYREFAGAGDAGVERAVVDRWIRGVEARAKAAARARRASEAWTRRSEAEPSRGSRPGLLERLRAFLQPATPALTSAGVTGTVTDPRGRPLDATVTVQEPAPTPEDLVEGRDVPWTERDAGMSQVTRAGPDGKFSVPGDVPAGSSLLVAHGWEKAELPLPPDEPTVVAKEPATPRPPPERPGTTVADDPRTAPPTRERPRWPPPPEIPPIPPETPPPPPDEKLERDKPCCRLVGLNVFYPVTREWLKAPAMQEAFNEPAIAADRVFLHDLSLFDNAVALFVKSVGYPFEFSHHYRSNVTTEKGGILGHKRDFVYNARIVPLNKRPPTADGLQVEQLGTDRVPLLHANGQGRVDQYEVVETDFVARRVRNFGAVFRAFVTTYLSPPGAFHEIQRYVLPDGEPHPFARHPNVEKVGDATERVFYVIRDKYGFRWIFNCRGQLIYASDRNENLMTFIYDSERPLDPLTQNPVLKTIVDTNGRSYELEYEDRGEDVLFTNFRCKLVQGTALIPRLKSITDFDGRKIVFSYTGAPNDPVLESVSWEPFGPGDLERGITFETRYRHTGDFLLESITAPREAARGGPPYLTITWNGARVGRMKLGGTVDGREAGGEFEITPTGSGALVKDRVGNIRRYDLRAVSTSMVVTRLTLTGARGDDRGPWTTEFLGHNGDYQVGEIVLPRKNRIRFTYDTANEQVTQGAVRNKADDYTYASNLTRGNLLSVARASGRAGEPDLVTEVTYDPLYSQITGVTDARKNTVTWEYANVAPNSFFDRISGDEGNARVIRYPPVAAADGTPLATADGTPPALTVERTYEPSTGLLSSVKDTGGHVTTYRYGSGARSGYVSSIGLPNGQGISFESDSRGNVIRMVDMGGTATRFDVNKRDLVVRKIEDERGFANTTDYFHDGNGNVVRIVVDRKDNFDDAAARALGLASRLRRRVATKLTYDLLNQRVEVVEDAEGPGAAALVTTLGYDGNGNVERVGSPSPAHEGSVLTTYLHDGRGLLEAITRNATPGPPSVVKRAYDANGNLEIVTDPRCGAIPARAAAGGSPTAQCPFTRYAYDGYDRLAEIANPLGAVRRHARIDPNGNLEEVTVTGPTGDGRGGQGLLAKATYRYDSLNRLIEQTQHVLRVVDGGRVREDAGAALVTRWFYDRDGRVERIVGPGEAETTYRHDALHRPERITDAEGNEARYEYDAAGNLAVLREIEREPRVATPTPMPGQFDGGAREFVTRWTYDALRRPVARTDAGGHSRRLFYDSLDLVRGQIDEDGRALTMAHDNVRRVTELNRLGRRTIYEYYPAGTAKRVRTPIVERTFEYDLLGRMTVAREGRAVTRIQPDAAGNPVTVTDPNGTVVTTEFNGLNLPTRVDATPGTVMQCAVTGGATAPAIDHLEGVSGETFRYDGLGRLVHASNGPAAIERVHDGLGRLLTEAQSFRPPGRRLEDTQVVATAHDPGLERIETFYPAIAGGSRVVTTLDRLGRVVRKQVGARDLVEYLYAGRDRVAWARAGNLVETFRQYDDERKPWRVTLAQTGDVLASWQIAFDVHAPVRVAEETRTDAGRRFRIVETTLDRERRPVVTRTYGFTRLDSPPSPGLLEGLRRVLTGVGTGDLAQVEMMLTETLRRHDDAGRVTRIVEASYDEVNEAFGHVRTDELAYDDAGRTASTRTRLGLRIAPGPGAAAGLVRSALTAAKAIAVGMRQAVASAQATSQPFAESRVFGGTIDQAFDLAESLVASPTFPPEIQAFRYDCNGNLIADGRYQYGYDHRNRLTRLRDTLPRRGNAFYSVRLHYDPLGRRVFADYDPDSPADALADTRFLYDDRRLIAEIATDAGDGGGALLARYFHGRTDGEVVRMDRRPEDRAGDALVVNYLHDGREEEPFVTTGDVGVARARRPAVRDVGVIRDGRFVEGTTTRFPYSTRSTLREPLSGLACEEATPTCVFDFRSAPRTELLRARQEFRDALLEATSALHRDVLTVLAAEVGPILAAELAATAVGQAALGWGVFGVGVDFTLTKLAGHDYTIEQGLAAFGLAAMSAGFSASMMASLGPTPLARLAGTLTSAFDVASGTALDVLVSGLGVQDALVVNLAVNAAAEALPALRRARVNLRPLVVGRRSAMAAGNAAGAAGTATAPAAPPAARHAALPEGAGAASAPEPRVPAAAAGRRSSEAPTAREIVAAPDASPPQPELRIRYLGIFEEKASDGEIYLRPIVVVFTPSGPRAFYTRTGSGGANAGGAQAGDWAPFEGFAKTPGAVVFDRATGYGIVIPVGGTWMVKYSFTFGMSKSDPLYRFGTQENLEIARWLAKQKIPADGPVRHWKEIQADLEALGVPTLDPVPALGGIPF